MPLDLPIRLAKMRKTGSVSWWVCLATGTLYTADGNAQWYIGK